MYMYIYLKYELFVYKMLGILRLTTVIYYDSSSFQV